MNITVLAATGRTGRALTEQLLARGHDVTALVRDPARLPARERLVVVAVDVRSEESVRRAVGPDAVVISGLGSARGDRAGTLAAGARAVVAARPARVIWLGAYGSGTSASVAGVVTRTLLKLMGAELVDKVTADTTVLDAGGTVFHAGPLSAGPISTSRHTVGLSAVPRRIIPARVSRATVAAAMIDEAEHPRFLGLTAVPLER